MTKKLLGRMHRGQTGITGLETAIILIAFVVVAAVFAYTVLSVGLFSTQKSQEAIHSGLEETRSTLELRTGVTASMTTDANVMNSDGTANDNNTVNLITRVKFIISTALDGESISLRPSYTGDTSGITPSVPDEHTTVISLVDQNVNLTDMAWTVTWLGSDNGDYLLDSEERAEITIWFVNNDSGVYKMGASGSAMFYSDDEDLAATELVDTNHEFTIQVKPEAGATLTIERTTPAYLDLVNDLH